MNARSTIERWIAAFNAHDVQAVAACYHRNAVNHQVAAGEPVHGVKAIRADLIELFQAFPDIWARPENLMTDGPRAAWEWIGGGTLTGPFLGFEPNGRSYELRGCGFFRIDDDLIVEQRGYWDRAQWFCQLGLPFDGS